MLDILKIKIFWKNHWVIVLAVFLYILFFGTLGCVRHYTFQTTAYDMGVFEHSFWNAVQGHSFFNTLENTNHLAVHFSPLMFLLVPFYYMWPSAYMLLILQTIFIGLGAVPLYLLGGKFLTKSVGLVLAIAYLFYPFLHNLNLYDWHAVALAIPLLLWAIYLAETQRFWLSAACLMLAIGVKENVPLAVIFLGIYWSLVGKGKKKYFGLSLIGAGLIYSIMVHAWLMPFFGDGEDRSLLGRYSKFGSNLGEIVWFLVTHPSAWLAEIFAPEKIFYMFKIFLPVGFVFLFAPLSLILLIPGLAQNLLSGYSYQVAAKFQYEAILVPFIFYGVFLGMKKVAKKRPPMMMAIKIILIVASVYGYLFYSQGSAITYRWSAWNGFWRADSQVQEIHRELNQVPAGVTVAADINLLPHLIKRDEIYVAGTEKYLTDWVILVKGKEVFSLTKNISQAEYLKKYLMTGDYEIRDLGDNLLALVRVSNGTGKKIEADFSEIIGE